MNFLKPLFSNIKTAYFYLLKSLAQVFWKDKRLRFLVYLGVILNIIAWGFFYWILSREQAGIIVHYNAFLGIDIFLYMSNNTARFVDIFLGPISGTFFLVINTMIVVLLMMFVVGEKKDDPVISSEKNVKKNNSKNLGNTYLFGSHMVLGGNIVLQLAIVIYSIAIAIVNY